MGKYKRRSRKERIHEIQLAALEVFLEKGYRDTTMEDIIKNTTLSKGGFYNYYGNKDDILNDLIRAKNYNYIRSNLGAKEASTPEEICQHLAQVFVDRMTDQNTQNKLHLMMAMELANNTQSFYDLYYEVENESLELIISAIKHVVPNFDAEGNTKAVMLLYRINNTLHFVKNLYAQTETWQVDQNLLYDLYYQMLMNIVNPKNDLNCKVN